MNLFQIKQIFLSTLILLKDDPFTKTISTFIQNNPILIQQQDRKQQRLKKFETWELRFYSQLKQHFQIEYQKQILHYNVDFYIKPNVIIEINGPQHYQQQNQLKKKDLLKRKVLSEMGYELYDINLKNTMDLDQNMIKQIQELQSNKSMKQQKTDIPIQILKQFSK